MAEANARVTRELEETKEQLAEASTNAARALETSAIQMSAQERETLAAAAELDQYRTLDAERKQWEAREQRAVDQRDSVRRELSAHTEGRGGVMYTTLNRIF